MKQLKFEFNKPIAFVLQYDYQTMREWDVYKNTGNNEEFKSKDTYNWLIKQKCYSNSIRFEIFEESDFPKELVDWSKHTNQSLLRWPNCHYAKLQNHEVICHKNF